MISHKFVILYCFTLTHRFSCFYRVLGCVSFRLAYLLPTVYLFINKIAHSVHSLFSSGEALSTNVWGM